jgi:hypothetical protein
MVTWIRLGKGGRDHQVSTLSILKLKLKISAPEPASLSKMFSPIGLAPRPVVSRIPSYGYDAAFTPGVASSCFELRGGLPNVNITDRPSSGSPSSLFISSPLSIHRLTVQNDTRRATTIYASTSAFSTRSSSDSEWNVGRWVALLTGSSVTQLRSQRGTFGTRFVLLLSVIQH